MPEEYAVGDINIYMIYLKKCDIAYIPSNTTPIIIIIIIVQQQYYFFLSNKNVTHFRESPPYISVIFIFVDCKQQKCHPRLVRLVRLTFPALKYSIM